MPSSFASTGKTCWRLRRSLVWLMLVQLALPSVALLDRTCCRSMPKQAAPCCESAPMQMPAMDVASRGGVIKSSISPASLVASDCMMQKTPIADDAEANERLDQQLEVLTENDAVHSPAGPTRYAFQVVRRVARLWPTTRAAMQPFAPALMSLRI